MNAQIPKRPRDAGATRQAILASARAAFARKGYDGAGVREIAKGAGVTAMLVNRYFGSKEQLFREALADAMRNPSVLTEDALTARAPARDIASALVEQTTPGAKPLEGFLIVLHSASSERAAEFGRDLVEAYHHKALTAAMEGPLRAERAAIALSLVLGFQVMRQMIGLKALVEADPVDLERILNPLLQQLIEDSGS